MAANLLNEEQQNTLLEWLAAEYPTSLIRLWFTEREWPEITEQAISYYRKQLSREITAARKRRRNSALNKGLAVKEERVAQLVEHAGALKAIMWIPDDHGKYVNEKAWRETLDDIAKEVGGRVHKAEVAADVKQNGTLKVVVQYADSDPLPEEYPDDAGQDEGEQNIEDEA